MALIVRAFPVSAGKEDAVLRFAESIGGERKDDATAFLRTFGVRRETWHLQRTEQGTQVIVVTDVEDPPEMGQAYGAAQGSFERWFKDAVKELSGVDPDTQPLGPPTRTIFSWDVGNRRETFDAVAP